MPCRHWVSRLSTRKSACPTSTPYSSSSVIEMKRARKQMIGPDPTRHDMTHIRQLDQFLQARRDSSDFSVDTDIPLFRYFVQILGRLGRFGGPASTECSGR